MRSKLRTPLAFASVLATAFPALAGNYAIDPDPRSPTLGELLDREKAARAPVPRPVPPAMPVERVVNAQPIIPAGAVTVLAPGVRPRAATTRR